MLGLDGSETWVVSSNFIILLVGVAARCLFHDVGGTTGCEDMGNLLLVVDPRLLDGYCVPACFYGKWDASLERRRNFTPGAAAEPSPACVTLMARP